MQLHWCPVGAMESNKPDSQWVVTSILWGPSRYYWRKTSLNGIHEEHLAKWVLENDLDDNYTHKSKIKYFLVENIWLDCGCVVLKLFELWLTFANGNCQGLKMYKSKIVHTSWWLQAGVPGELLQLDLSGILTWCQVSQNPLLPILFHLYPRKYWIFASPLQFLLALWQPEKTRVNIW